MKPFDYNNYLKNNRLLKEMDEAKNNEDELWFSNAEYFRDEHKGYKLKPTDKVSIGSGPIMTYADAVKKYASGKIKEGDVEESFKDRIAAKRTQRTTDMTTPKGDLAVIFDAIKKEAGSDYEVSFNKDSIFILPDIGSGVVGRTIGVRILQDPGNKAITVGATNGTIDTSGSRHISNTKRFNPKDMQGILDYCEDLLDQIESQNG